MVALRYTASAENDLLETWLYVAQDNPQAADRIVDMIDLDARQLLAHPHIGRKRPELAPELRSWPTSTRYVLYYLADADGIVIARVLHHARDTTDVTDWPHD